MKSMTGFGKAAMQSPTGVVYQAEISSVNKKQLEIRPILPRELTSLEPFIRETLSSRISRGTISVRLAVSFSGSSPSGSVKVNESVLNVYLKKLRAVAERNEVRADVDLAELLALPGVVEYEYPDLLEDDELQTLKEVLELAMDNLDEMRWSEGTALEKDLHRRFSSLKEMLERISPLAAKVPLHQKEQLLKRLQASGLDIKSDDDRMLKEVAIFCDRSDISEELTRLASHIAQADAFMKEKKSPVGRSLDFLVQEMFREITTLGNKAAGIEITPIVIEFKTELEKIREQIQNVE